MKKEYVQGGEGLPLSSLSSMFSCFSRILHSILGTQEVRVHSPRVGKQLFFNLLHSGTHLMFHRVLIIDSANFPPFFFFCSSKTTVHGLNKF